MCLQTRQLSLEDVQGLFGDSVDDAVVIEESTFAHEADDEKSKGQNTSVIPAPEPTLKQ